MLALAATSPTSAAPETTNAAGTETVKPVANSGAIKYGSNGLIAPPVETTAKPQISASSPKTAVRRIRFVSRDPSSATATRPDSHSSAMGWPIGTASTAQTRTRPARTNSAGFRNLRGKRAVNQAPGYPGPAVAVTAVHIGTDRAWLKGALLNCHAEPVAAPVSGMVGYSP